MQGSREIESLVMRNGDTICIIRDIYERNAPECHRCVLRRVCNMKLSEDKLDAVLGRINAQLFRREFYDDLEAFYNDDTYSEV